MNDLGIIWNADGTFNRLSNIKTPDFVYTPSEYPLGLFGQNLASQLTSASANFSNGFSGGVVTSNSSVSPVIVGVGLALAAGAVFLALKPKK